MTVQQLDFAEPFFQIDYVEDEACYEVTTKSLVLNLALRSQTTMYITQPRMSGSTVAV